MQHSSEVYLTVDMLSNEIKYYLYECDRKKWIHSINLILTPKSGRLSHSFPYVFLLPWF